MPLKVIGAGFGRTGTLSLKLALERLGFGPCYHMAEVIQIPSAVADWTAVFDGAQPDWERIFKGYNATVDWPSTAVWRELSEAYPEAKVILTVRDPVEWWESTQATIFARMGSPPTNPFEAMLQKMIARHFEPRLTDKAYMVEMFERHTADVRASLPPERLLVYQVKEGWAPLCRFLGVPAPDEPMPRVNDREDFKARFAGGRPH